VEIKQLSKEPPNKALAKHLLKHGSRVPNTFLDITEAIFNAHELYEQVSKFMSEANQLDDEAPLFTRRLPDGYGRGYELVVNEKCAVRWLGKIYGENEVIGKIFFVDGDAGRREDEYRNRER
jgi:hypothetical protein